MIVRSVAGDLAPEALGSTLMHEHLTIDMRPEWEQTGPVEPVDELVAAILPALAAARDEGVQALVECTRPGHGQRLDVYRAASDRAGVAVITAVGWYRDPWLPPWVRAAPAETLAAWCVAGLRAYGFTDRYLKEA